MLLVVHSEQIADQLAESPERGGRLKDRVGRTAGVLKQGGIKEHGIIKRVAVFVRESLIAVVRNAIAVIVRIESRFEVGLKRSRARVVWIARRRRRIAVPLDATLDYRIPEPFGNT